MKYINKNGINQKNKNLYLLNSKEAKNSNYFYNSLNHMFCKYL